MSIKGLLLARDDREMISQERSFAGKNVTVQGVGQVAEIAMGDAYERIISKIWISR